MPGSFKERKGLIIFLISLVLVAAVVIGVATGHYIAEGDRFAYTLSSVLVLLVLLTAYLLYRYVIAPSYRGLEDANLELHLKQEELLDIKDDLFIKFLGVYDVNYAANSPRLFADRLRDVVDITARVMEADVCLIFLFDKKKDDLVLAATNETQQRAIGTVRVPLGEGIEGWVGRRLEPLMLRDFHSDPRFKETSGLLRKDYLSLYCLPLYVYSNGALVGVMETLYRKPKTFSDEEINFFTTLSGILSTTIQNEQMQAELRKMNMELEQWVTEKTEELRASEERYRTVVENAPESIFLLAENGDILFANEQAALLSGYPKYDLLHKNLFELFVDQSEAREVAAATKQERRTLHTAEFRQADGVVVPVAFSAVSLTLMGKHFIQSVIRDISVQAGLERQLRERELELSELRARLENKN